ncbi:hypothetical protein KW801_01905 [Candidatus Saccharibacteria bacterium]|nr:hypothetical protein [Candidatus Saccharibacteria bacterium]
MNPNRGESSQANFELPPQPVGPEGEDQRQEMAQEAPAAAPETVGKQAPAPALQAIPDDIPAIDAPIIAVPAPDTTVPAHPASDHPAHDSDHIEPLWVNKAKEVIARTQDDPYLQKSEMSKVKADYIQKRFGKQIKTDEAAA